jgi:hypothetical protein
MTKGKEESRTEDTEVWRVGDGAIGVVDSVALVLPQIRVICAIRGYNSPFRRAF